MVMLIGLLFAAAGVSFSLKAALGTSPIGCCPAVYSQPLHISVGTAMWIMCGFFIIAQIVILRREFQPLQFFQLLVAYLFGYLTDFTSVFLSNLAVNSLWLKIVLCALGILSLAWGVFLLLKADLFMLSPDALLAIISKKYKLEFSRIKVIMDCSMVAVAAIGSLLMYQKLVHVGIGTLASATFVGIIIGRIKKFRALNQVLDKIVNDGESST